MLLDPVYGNHINVNVTLLNSIVWKLGEENKFHAYGKCEHCCDQFHGLRVTKYFVLYEYSPKTLVSSQFNELKFEDLQVYHKNDTNFSMSTKEP